MPARFLLRSLTARAAGMAAALTLFATVSGAQTFGQDLGGNYLPFGCGGCLGNPYQQIYSHSGFASGAQLINSITFYPHSQGDQSWYGATYSLYFSTTSAAVDGLSGTQSNNWGADRAFFGSITPTGQFLSALTITGTPFLYNPSSGNLLLDIYNSGPSNNVLTSAAYTYDGTDGMSRTYGASTDSGGLVTTFDATETDPAPEPASLLLMATGLVAMAATRRRRAGK